MRALLLLVCGALLVPACAGARDDPVARRQVEQRLSDDITRWQRRVDTLETRAARTRDREAAQRARRLDNSLRQAERQLQQLQQVEPPAWPDAQRNTSSAIRRFERVWNEEMSGR